MSLPTSYRIQKFEVRYGLKDHFVVKLYDAFDAATATDLFAPGLCCALCRMSPSSPNPETIAVARAGGIQKTGKIAVERATISHEYLVHSALAEVSDAYDYGVLAFIAAPYFGSGTYDWRPADVRIYGFTVHLTEMDG